MVLPRKTSLLILMTFYWLGGCEELSKLDSTKMNLGEPKEIKETNSGATNYGSDPFENYISSKEETVAATPTPEPPYPVLSLHDGVEDINDQGSSRLGLAFVSSTAETNTYTITNSGTAELNITDVSITDGDTSDFSLSNTAGDDSSQASPYNLTNPPLATIQPTETHTFSIWFSPTSSGRKSATVTIASDAKDAETYTFTVSGTTEWSNKFVDGDDPADGMNLDNTVPMESPQFAEHNGKLYVIWDEDFSGHFNIRVAEFNGDTSNPDFTHLEDASQGLNYNHGKHAYNPHTASCNGKLYATWQEEDYATGTDVWQARVSVFNEVSSTWSFVDGNKNTGINRVPTEDSHYPRLLCHKSNLYIFTASENSTIGQVRVAKYNGNDSSPSWSDFDGGGSAGLNYDTSFKVHKLFPTVFDGQMTVIWSEKSIDNTIGRIRVSIYNENSTTWQRIDGGAISGINFNRDNYAEKPALAVHKSELFAFWFEKTHSYEGDVFMVAVGKKFNGDPNFPSWTSVGTDISESTTYIPWTSGMRKITTAIYRDKLYLIYPTDNAKTTAHKLKVKVFNDNAASPGWTSISGSAGTINRDPTQNAFNGDLISFGNRLFATWYEYGLTYAGCGTLCGSGEPDQLRITTFND